MLKILGKESSFRFSCCLKSCLPVCFHVCLTRTVCQCYQTSEQRIVKCRIRVLFLFLFVLSLSVLISIHFSTFYFFCPSAWSVSLLSALMFLTLSQVPIIPLPLRTWEEPLTFLWWVGILGCLVRMPWYTTHLWNIFCSAGWESTCWAHSFWTARYGCPTTATDWKSTANVGC